MPFTAWFQSGGLVARASRSARIAVVAIIVGVRRSCVASPAVRRLGVDIRLWSISYALYLLAVFFPQSSTFRILAPLFPLLGAFALPRARWYRWGSSCCSCALQVGWLLICWGIDGRDWTPP